MTQTAIVTGASGGIGQGVAERLAKDGFAVVAHYAGNPAKAEETVKRIEAAGGTAIAVGADISKVAEVAQLFEKAKSAFGEITVVVNSAGIMVLAPIRKGDIENFNKVIATNLRGSYLVMSEAANHVVDGGRIIAFSSSVLGKSSRRMVPISLRRQGSKVSREFWRMNLDRARSPSMRWRRGRSRLNCF